MSNADTVNERKRSFATVSDGDNEEPQQKRGNTATIEDKKMKRVMANRRSAKESRERRKQLLTDLEASVDILTKENTALSAENAELRKQLVLLLPQARANMSLVPQQAPSQRSFTSDFLNTSALRRSELMRNAALSKERALFDASLLRQIQF